MYSPSTRPQPTDLDSNSTPDASSGVAVSVAALQKSFGARRVLHTEHLGIRERDHQVDDARGEPRVGQPRQFATAHLESLLQLIQPRFGHRGGHRLADLEHRIGAHRQSRLTAAVLCRPRLGCVRHHFRGRVGLQHTSSGAITHRLHLRLSAHR